MTAATDIDEALLRGWPLPQPGGDADKEDRGRVLVVAGSAEMPGAALLAAEAALRAGAGKLVVGTAASIAPWLAQALPEARVVALPEDGHGGLAVDGVARLDALLPKAAAVLVGPGLQPEASACRFVCALLPRLHGTPLLLDAAAMGVVREGAALPPGTLLTPHAGELAHLSGQDKAQLQAEPAEAALQAARRWQAVVAHKGAQTWLAAPDGRLWRHDGAQPGLGTSGSGDVLAGLIAGLRARGAPPEQAAAWGIALHARAGRRLAERQGPLGYLARELAVQVPALMHTLSADAAPGG